MIVPEAEALIEYVDATWKMGLADDDYGHERWLTFFQSQEDAAVMMVVLQRIAARQRDRVTIGDVKNALYKESAPAAATEEEFAREMPEWVKAWMVARATGDTRVLIEQKPGYDFMQLAHPHTRTFVWPEQELMPDDARAEYVAKAAQLGADLHKVFAAVTGV